MAKESLIYTPLTPLEKTHLRRTAWWMYGLMAAGCLALVSLTPLCCGLLPPDPEVLFVIGAAIMVLAIPFHILAGCKRCQKLAWQKALYLPSILLNLLGVSFFEAAYYARIGVDPPETDLIAGAVIPIGLCLLCALAVTCLTHYIALLIPLGCVLSVAGIIVSTVFWVKAGLSASSVLWSFALFNLVGVLIVSVALFYAENAVSDTYGDPLPPAPEAIPENDDSGCIAPVSEEGELHESTSHSSWDWLRYLSFASFGLFMIVGAVILVVLMIAGGDCDCDCDCCDCDCDCCDCGGSSGSSGKKKRKRR